MDTAPVRLERPLGWRSLAAWSAIAAAGLLLASSDRAGWLLFAVGCGGVCGWFGQLLFRSTLKVSDRELTRQRGPLVWRRFRLDECGPFEAHETKGRHHSTYGGWVHFDYSPLLGTRRGRLSKRVRGSTSHIATRYGTDAPRLADVLNKRRSG